MNEVHRQLEAILFVADEPVPLTQLAQVTETARDVVLGALEEMKATAVEINANPARLDMDAHYARTARELGVLVPVNTDAHAPDNFDLLPYGVATARRAWLGPGQAVLYGTSPLFLERMGLGGLEDLPPIASMLPAQSVADELEP